MSKLVLLEAGQKCNDGFIRDHRNMITTKINIFVVIIFLAARQVAEKALPTLHFTGSCARIFVAKQKVKRMSGTAALGFEERLRREIEEIERQIRELTLEKQALERQLLKARRASSALSDVSRKNSLTRILVEEKILDALRAAKRSLSNPQLYREAKAIDANLKSSTFRTYLHRMKARGLIVSTGTNGNWKAASGPSGQD